MKVWCFTHCTNHGRRVQKDYLYNIAEELVTLRFGDDVGDLFGPYSATNDFVSREIQLDGRYIFYGKEQRSLYVSE